MKIGVTGCNGLLGWHARCFIEVADGMESIGASRQDFANPVDLMISLNNVMRSFILLVKIEGLMI